MRGSVALLAVAAGLVASDRPTERAAPELPPWFGDRSAPPVVIRGVVHSDRLPLTVRLAIGVSDPSIWPGVEVQTDAAGRFDFGPQRRGHYLLQAFDDDDASRVVTVNAGNGDVAIDVFSYPCREITGRVGRAPVQGYSRDDVLPPVAGARVELLGRTVATSDATGQFRFCGPRDEVVVFGRARGLTVGFGWAFTAGAESPQDFLVVPLADGVVIDGVVVDADGRPVSGVGVQPVYDPRVSHGGPSPAPVIATTDEGGRFHAEGLHDGAYVFEILDGVRSVVIRDGVADGFQLPVKGPLRLVMPVSEPTKTAPAAPRERQGVWLRGRVVHDGRPVPDAVVTGVPSERGVLRRRDTARSRPDGSFALFAPTSSRLVRHAYTVEVEHGGLDLRGRVAFDVDPDGADHDGVIVEVDRHRGVTGTVVDPQGNAIAGVVVSRFDRDDGEPTDATGAFCVPIDPSAAYPLRAFDAAGNELRPPAGSMAPRVRAELYGRDAPPIRFVVERTPARIHGVVVDERGARVRARVRVVSLGGGDAVDTDARGEFALDQSLDDETPVIVAAEAADGRVAYQQDVYIDTTVRLVLHRPARLVVACGAQLGRRATISVTQGALERSVRCDQELGDLPPGRFQLFARADDGDAIARVDLRAGVRTRHTLVIAPRRMIRARVIEAAGGAPVEGARCDAVVAETRWTVLVGGILRATSDGELSLRPAEGRLRLRCERSGFVRAETAPFDVSTVDGVIDVPMVRQRLDAVDLDVDVRPHPLGAVVVAISDELAAAGLRVGDVVEAADGIPVAGLDLDSVTELAFRRSAGAELTWEVRRGDKRVTVRAP